MNGTLMIQSGGQTGADRAALDWAIENGISHRGWCPFGRMAEDGPLSECYQLRETASPAYAERTRLNVLESDGTAILTVGIKLGGGSLLTKQEARKAGKPVVHLNTETASPEKKLLKFVKANSIEVLNVAGPRASGEPGAYAFVKAVLDAAFT